MQQRNFLFYYIDKLSVCTKTREMTPLISSVVSVVCIFQSNILVYIIKLYSGPVEMSVMLLFTDICLARHATNNLAKRNLGKGQDYLGYRSGYCMSPLPSLQISTGAISRFTHLENLSLDL